MRGREMIDDDLIYKVAIAYYVDKKKQREIADELKVSRVQISNYLKMAESRGLIRVEVVPPSVNAEERSHLKTSLQRKFALKELLLCPSYNTPKVTSETLFQLTEQYIFSTYGTNPLTVGIGWGHTSCTFVEQLGEHNRLQWNIVPLAGGSGKISEKYYNVNYIVQRLADKLHAQFQLLYLPFFIDSMAESQNSPFNGELKRIKKYWDNLDLIICSVGSQVTNSPLFQKGVVGEKSLANLKKSQYCGDLLAHFFDINGNIIETGIEERMVNISFEQLKRVKTKMVITMGHEKNLSVLGALRAGLIDVLVTDYETVNFILRS